MKDDSLNREPEKTGTVVAGNKIILSPNGPLTCQNCQDLEDTVRDSVNQYKAAVILDCKDIPFLDSAVLELLLKLHQELRDIGCALRLANLNTICQDILIATRLTHVLPVYQDIHEAIKAEA